MILGAPLDRARRYAADLKAPFPILADSDRAIYHQFGLERAMLVIQRTASIIVDRSGIIRYLKRVTNPQTWLAEATELTNTVKHLPK